MDELGRDLALVQREEKVGLVADHVDEDPRSRVLQRPEVQLEVDRSRVVPPPHVGDPVREEAVVEEVALFNRPEAPEDFK